MVAKEIDMAMMAYNLVRAVTCLAAQKAGLPPLRMSPKLESCGMT
jgi:hypothetical protein